MPACSALAANSVSLQQECKLWLVMVVTSSAYCVVKVFCPVHCALTAKGHWMQASDMYTAGTKLQQLALARVQLGCLTGLGALQHTPTASRASAAFTKADMLL